MQRLLGICSQIRGALAPQGAPDDDSEGGGTLDQGFDGEGFDPGLAEDSRLALDATFRDRKADGSELPLVPRFRPDTAA